MRRLMVLVACLAGLLCGQAPKKASLVMVEKVSGHVGFYDLAGRCLAEVKAGAHPHEMVFSPDHRFLYVTNNGMLWMTDPGDGENTVSIIDLAAQKSLGMIDLGVYRRPHGIDIDPVTGNLLVTTEKPSMLLLVDPRSRKILKQYDVKGEAPHMVLLAADRRWAFVSNSNTGTLAAVDLETARVTSIPVGERPQGAVLSPDKRTLYVTNLGSNNISIVDVATRRRTGDIATGQGPCRLALTPDGKTLIYALQNGNAVGFADVQSGKEVAQVALPGQPVSLNLSADRKQAYSAVQMQDKVLVIDIVTRKIVQVINTPKGSGPDPVYPLP